MSGCVIVILNYNDFSTCQRLLEKIKDYAIFDKIVIVDNCSTDDSVALLKKYKSQKVDLIVSPNNGGYASGNNFGIRYSIEKYNPKIIFVANPDVLFEENVAYQMAKTLSANNEYGIVAPLVIQGYNVWKQPGFWGTLESLLLIIFNLDKKRIKDKLAKETLPQEVGVVEGSFFAISKEAYMKTDGFDERTFLYFEENILGMKLKQSSLKTVVLPQLYYEHLHSNSIRKEYKSKARAFHNFYPSVKMYLQEYAKVNRFQLLIFEIVYGFALLERHVYDFCKRLQWGVEKYIWKKM